MYSDEEDYLQLLGLLVRVVEGNRGAQIPGLDDRFWYAEGLAHKFFDHASAILYLSRGTSIPDLSTGPVKYHDISSIEVLARASLETFLTVHYVFVAPQTADEQDCRYWAWRAAGLAERQSLPVVRKENREKLEQEKRDIDDFHRKLRGNSVFQRLDKDSQARLLGKSKKGKRLKNVEWRLAGWPSIAEDAGLTGYLAQTMYRHLCGYAHSSSLSILQIRQAGQEKEQIKSIRSSILFMCIVTANFIGEYCELFPLPRGVLEADPTASQLVGKWIYLGREVDATKLASSGEGDV